MSTDETYNGWTNWDTWCTFLWLSNDESTYNEGKGIVWRSTIEWEGWLEQFVAMLDRVLGESIDFAKVNRDEIREALLE